MKSAVTNGQALCLKYNLKEAWKVYYLNLFLYCLTEESLFTHSPLSRKMIGRIVEWQISLSIASVRSRLTESLQLTFRDNATAQAPLFLKWFQLRSKWSILSFAASEKKKKKKNRDTCWVLKTSQIIIPQPEISNGFFYGILVKSITIFSFLKSCDL